MHWGNKFCFIVPHFHNGFYYTLSFSICFWITDFGKSLLNGIVLAECDKSMVARIATKFFAIVGISQLNGIGTFLKDLFEEFPGRPLTFVRKDRCV